ncbi:carbohydrate ABC transporter permease [Actinomadura sp. HBU206391]|uniref:carbohydrate ABC transporter permease n=1 Tax=Actinomadura sp. HBU206391 TaxID=2731692 RepID=UPI0021C8964D|nr:hypothetical protein [Actinomadura sp. HBU206391]
MAVSADAFRRVSRRPGLRRNVTSCVMLLPFLTLFAGFLIWPLANSLYLGFTEFDGVNPPEFNGLANFRRLLFEDDRFRQALGKRRPASTGPRPGSSSGTSRCRCCGRSPPTS